MNNLERSKKMTLEEANKNIDRKVIYTPFPECDLKDKETGVITSTNESFVFVRYGSDINSKATRPSDLEFEV
jgi:hypothetical protein